VIFQEYFQDVNAKLDTGRVHWVLVVINYVLIIVMEMVNVLMESVIVTLNILELVVKIRNVSKIVLAMENV